MKLKAQVFMNQQRIAECWECDGELFKHKDNADARAKASGEELITHSANAGVKQEEE